MKSLLSKPYWMLAGMAGVLALFSGFAPGGCGGLPPSSLNCNSDHDCGPRQYCDLPVYTQTGQAQTGGAALTKQSPPREEEVAVERDEPQTARCGVGRKERRQPQYAGVCRTRPNHSTCRSDGDCKRSEYCSMNQSSRTMILCDEPDNPRCGGVPSSGICVKKPTQTSCTSDRDCSKGFFCNTNSTPPAPPTPCAGSKDGGSDVGVRCVPVETEPTSAPRPEDGGSSDEDAIPPSRSGVCEPLAQPGTTRPVPAQP